MASVCSRTLSVGGGARMFEKRDHQLATSQSVRVAVLLRIGLHLSCQLGKSFPTNAIALAALCHMSDIVENPTTSAQRNHRINLRRGHRAELKQ
ncbi:hypothetical protein [Mesorhizobium escarrei]|uniref:Uncharacterized protein n=1 Tax=Mesorhizobium escarrei TaxID=666018 RepID=A0ABN8JL00_9HYPH|nr:hypothetical protein [Mesorhizobium escarrei]CAH2398044.1 hypothetical protein MES5069_190008 [Mesorhizobium escarrei]